MTSYIPRGYVTTADAVDRVFMARHPDLAASASARDAEQRRLAVRNVELSINTSYIPKVAAPHIVIEKFEAEVLERIHVLERIGELQQIEAEVLSLKKAATNELRAGALAEGDLVAFLNYKEMPQVERSRWREDDGLIIVQHARLGHQVKGTPAPPVEITVVIKEADLAGGLCSLLQTDPDALKEDEGDVRSASLTERQPKPDTPDELVAWHPGWAKENPLASDDDAIKAARDEFGERITERQVIDLRKPKDGPQRKRGPKVGKTYAGRR